MTLLPYARVAINVPIDRAFDYVIPPELGAITVGHLVQVPFRTGLQHGIVVECHDRAPGEVVLKPIHALAQPDPVITPEQIAFAYWLRETYLAPIGACLWLWLTPGLTHVRDIRVELIQADQDSYPASFSPPPPGEGSGVGVPSSADASGAGDAADNDRSIMTLAMFPEWEDESAEPPPPTLPDLILERLQRRGAQTGSRLKNAFPDANWRGALEKLAKAGQVQITPIFGAPRVRPKSVDSARLAVTPDEIPGAVLTGIRSLRADLIDALAAAPDRRADETRVKREAHATKTHVEKLIADGLITRENGDLRLLIAPERIEKESDTLRGIEAMRRVLRLLGRENGALDLSWIYAQTDASIDHLRALEADGWIDLETREIIRDPLAKRTFAPTEPLHLTTEQAAAYDALREALHTSEPGDGWRGAFLLLGVTGSGKTEIYLHLIAEAIRHGKSALFLVPEIALTPQTIERVAQRFGDGVSVVHSGLSPGQRYDTWRRARAGQVRVIVGARSALFAPLPDLGVIILDEEHDASYKNDMLAPHYDARRAAEERMRRAGGVVVFGSATPSIETMHRAETREISLLTLPRRILGHRTHVQQQAQEAGRPAKYRPAAGDTLTIDLPPVQVIDMRSELKAGNVGMFSRDLQTALEDVLRRGEQAILFLNRRGHASYVFCRDCGYVAACPRCNAPLTYHREGEALRCHRCAYQRPAPTQCPKCGSPRIKFFGAGTQQVEAAAKARFPAARIVRWDADTASVPEAHEAILNRFVHREADIMVGTQMVAKGLDLPRVTLVGVISADTHLNLPDFRAAEKTFQLLTQVAGRAGRGVLGGRVILQTYQPEHYAIDTASRHDYAAFYARELEARRALGYPPFRRLARLLFKASSSAAAGDEAARAADLIRQRIRDRNLTGTEIIGPAPAFFMRQNRQYRWSLTVRSPDPAAALRGAPLPPGWHIDIDPLDML